MIKKISEYARKIAIEAWDGTVLDGVKWLYRLGIGGFVLIVLGVIIQAFPEQQVKFLSEPYKTSNEWKVHPIVSYDNQGRYANFQFVSLPNDYVWKKGRSDVLSFRGIELSPEAFKEKVLADLKKLVRASSGLVALGSSSQEGDMKEEQLRAQERAGSLANWLLPIVSDKKGLFRLSIGQYQGEVGTLAGVSTAYQRPAIIVCILDWEENISIKEALFNAMRKQRDLPHPDSYSEFDIAQIRPMPKAPSGFLVWVRSGLQFVLNGF